MNRRGLIAATKENVREALRIVEGGIDAIGELLRIWIRLEYLGNEE